jgi:hypothetical protein
MKGPPLTAAGEMLVPECQPITFSFGLLEASLESVCDELRQWYGGQSVAHRLVPTTGTLASLLRRLEPLSAPFFKRLWVRTASIRWQTAYFDGFINGGDPFPPISYLASRLGVHGMAVTSQPDSKHCYGANKLELFGPESTEWLNVVWSVGAFNDGGRWVWRHSAGSQPFEEMTAYESRRIKDRFTPEMLRRYCAALAAPLDAVAYGPDAVLDLPDGVETTERRESLAEARVRCGLA